MIECPRAQNITYTTIGNLYNSVMLFNSGIFWLFFSVFFAAWWLVRNRLQARNALILFASYVFYGWWDVRFLGLIIFSTLLDYGVGLRLANTDQPRARKAWVACSIVGNLSVLGFFKYWNFFQESAAHILSDLGLQAHPFTLHIILPIGISFYTFQTMSYTLDVYRREMQATRDFIGFAAYVAFFPQLVAGPIERARNLLPQFQSLRVVHAKDIASGLDLIIWGLFKKVVIADQLAPFVDTVYANQSNGIPLYALATLAFGFQIYGDFSGYSDIARGLARLLGFTLVVNFNRPYTAHSLREFWRRWHISLSTWLRDYLYIPLGGNLKGPGHTLRNLWITMLLGGLWHGAGWPFIVWGAWQALGLTLEHVRPTTPTKRTHPAGRWWTLCWIFAGWHIFRMPSLTCLQTGWTALPAWTWGYVIPALALIGLLLLLENLASPHAPDGEAPGYERPWGPLLSGILLYGVFVCHTGESAPFIYFQF
jgi:alginate O-acetyltransferase complex protein AlgI